MSSINSSEDAVEIKAQNKDATIFLHASDIHLGSHQYRNEYRADDFIRAFQEILNLSISHNADFIILGGDVFTSLEMLPGKLTEIIHILTQFKDSTNGKILIIAIEGNHDIRRFSRGVRFAKRGQSWLKLLSNLGLLILLDGNMEAPIDSLYLPYNFKEKRGGKIQIKNVTIYGNHYLGENPEDFIPKITQAIEKEKNMFCILLQHFGVEGQMNNVPGIKYKNLIPLKSKVDYLALGHYHLQFRLDNWVYNPGSSEAVCSADSNFRRGIFLVEVKGAKNFQKKVYSIKLLNRNHMWKTIFIPYTFKNINNFIDFIIRCLKSELNYLKGKENLADPKIPMLHLILKGRSPLQNRKLDAKKLKAKIMESLNIVDVNIYQRFSNPVKSLNEFLYAR